MRRVATSILPVLALLAGPTRVSAQYGPPFDVRWEPEHPQQGTFVFVVVLPPKGATADGVDLTGSLAGQPLHFEVDRYGTLRALAAIPVNAATSIPVPLTMRIDGDRLDRLVRIPVTPGDFPSERLSVDPRFSRRPDSALAARIRRESRQSRAASRRSHDTPRLWWGEWVRPRTGRITSRFGTGRVFNGELRSRHMGTDLDGDTGDPIRAANRGVVRLVGDFYYAGNVVYLDHGRGLLTIYMHMSKVEVREGDIVDRGQVIGRVGATGRVTGPHLHWIGRYGRISVDPLTIFALDAGALPPPPDHLRAPAGDSTPPRQVPGSAAGGADTVGRPPTPR